MRGGKQTLVCSRTVYSQTVIFENHETMVKVMTGLERENVFPRRYFHPSLNALPYVSGESCPVSESICGRVLCLPFYHDLKEASVVRIAKIIASCF